MVKRLLLLGAETPALQRVVPLLLRADFEVHRAERPDEVESLVRDRHFDLIIARHPLAGCSLEALVAAVRAPGSASHSAGLLVLADATSVGPVGALLGRGVNRVVNIDGPSDRLLHAVADLVAVSARVNVRAMVQLELWVRHGATRLLTLTENISSTGMLVRGGREFPVGSRLAFELVLPDLEPVIRGEAEVVRHTDAELEHVDGIGATFATFEDRDHDRLVAFLGSLSA
jgi:hypothetical protein